MEVRAREQLARDGDAVVEAARGELWGLDDLDDVAPLMQEPGSFVPAQVGLEHAGLGERPDREANEADVAGDVLE